MATADLGWCIARCRIGEDPAAAELLIMSPGSEGEDCTELLILGLDAIIALRDLLDVEIDDAQHRRELLKDVDKRD
jgi:hypothetical protein